MSDRSYLQHQSAQLRRLLDEAGDDPILAPQLKQRLEDTEQELKSVEQEGKLFPVESALLPRAALFLRGGGVENNEGIRPTLAGEALIQYERMFMEQALHDERVAAREAGRHRRRRGSPMPSLLFTGTPRGSFGLEFVPLRTNEDSQVEVHAKSLQRVGDAIVQITARDRSLDEAIRDISQGVLYPLKKFLNVLAQYGAELRLATSDAPSRIIESEQIQLAAARLEKELVEEKVELKGVFRGLTRESTFFDLIADGIGVITGTIADSLTEEDLDRIDALTNERCVAEIQKTTLQPVGGPARATYLLLDAKREE